jgi:hypothetical protein
MICLNQSAARDITGKGNQKNKSVNALTSIGKDKWIEIAAPDGDFTAAFPVKPEYIFKEHPDPGLTQNNHIFLAQHNGHTLMVSYMDIILSPSEEYDEIDERKDREAYVIKATKKKGWELLRGTKLVGNGYQHIYFASPQKPGDFPAYFRAITFVHRSRVYLITYDALTQSELFGPEAKRFFNSFKFTSH